MGEPLKFVSETSGDLVKLVGYREIILSIGVSRSTIERAVKSGELPPPRKFKARAVWLASEINAWAEALFAGRLTNLANLATTNPDDLGAEELSQKALDLAVLAVSKYTGQQVDPEHVTLSYRPAASEDDEKLTLQRAMQGLASRISEFDEPRAAIIAAWLFPSLRPYFEWRDNSLAEPEALLSLAKRALDDDEWERMVEELRAAHLTGQLPGGRSH